MNKFETIWQRNILGLNDGLHLLQFSLHALCLGRLMRSEQDVGYFSSLGWFWRWWKASEGISVYLILIIYWFLNLFILMVLFARTLIFKTEEFMVRIDHVKH